MRQLRFQEGDSSGEFTLSYDTLQRDKLFTPYNMISLQSSWRPKWNNSHSKVRFEDHLVVTHQVELCLTLWHFITWQTLYTIQYDLSLIKLHVKMGQFTFEGYIWRSPPGGVPALPYNTLQPDKLSTLYNMISPQSIELQVKTWQLRFQERQVTTYLSEREVIFVS